MSYYKHKPLRFKCTNCGRCCYGNEDDYIQLSHVETERIRQQLGLGTAQFNQDYLCRLASGEKGIRILSSGRCSLLDHNNKCSVYEVRPLQCQSYPFWPELVNNKFNWKGESQRCEGINQGRVVALEYIEEQLELSAK